MEGHTGPPHSTDAGIGSFRQPVNLSCDIMVSVQEGAHDPQTMTVRFLLPTNLPGSMARITADTASFLAKKGIQTTILFPAVDWWDYKRFLIARLRGWRKWKWIAKVACEIVAQVPFRRRWCGLRCYRVDSRVHTRRYFLTPSATAWRVGDVAVVHPPYLIPHLLSTIPHPGITLISALHMNLEKAMNSPIPETAAWYRHWVARDRYIAIPRYTTSEASKQAAERLGIPIRRVIYDGCVDLTMFRPAPARLQGQPMVVSLYCDPNPQKGQLAGIRAIRAIRAQYPRVRIRSIGRVLPAHADVFHEQYGYLHQEALVHAFQESDIFVYPSFYDSFPAPPLQAMACGAAVVTTAVEGVVEYAVDGENALLCAPGDVGMLQAQIARLLDDDQLRSRLQARGPLTAEAFSLERSAQALLEFLRAVVDEESRRPTVMVEA